MSEAKKEAERVIGFDPFASDVLSKSGLGSSGAAVAGGDKENVIWIAPVADHKKFELLVTRILSTNPTIKKRQVKEPYPITVFEISFGEPVARAALAFQKGLAYVGLGPDAQKSVTTALSLKPQDAADTHPEYKEQFAINR